MLEAELAFSLGYLENAKSDREELALSILMFTEAGLLNHFETGWTPADDLIGIIDDFLFKRIPTGWIDLCKSEIILHSLAMQNAFEQGGFEKMASYDIHASSHYPLVNPYASEVLSLSQNAASKASWSTALIGISRIGLALEIFKRSNGCLLYTSDAADE